MAKLKPLRTTQGIVTQVLQCRCGHQWYASGKSEESLARKDYYAHIYRCPAYKSWAKKRGCWYGEA